VYQGNVALLARKPLDAEKSFRTVIELAPENPIGYTRLGFVHLSQRQPEKALKDFDRALRLQLGLRDALASSVLIFLGQRQFDKALEFCDRQSKPLPEDSPSRAFIYDLKGTVYLAAKKLPEAKRSFERALEIDPNLVSSYEALARIYLQQQDIESALSKYKEILAKRPSYFPAYMSLGTLYQHTGDIKEAESSYRKALEIREDFAPAANNLAWVLAEHGGNIDEALKWAQVAKEKMPQDPSIMDTLGWIYYKKDLYRSAIVELEQSHGKMPTNPAVAFHLGMAYLQNGQKEEAKEALDKALQISERFPGSEEAKKALRQLELRR
jgi:tetratricopeptide (TPR) repeat protein